MLLRVALRGQEIGGGILLTTSRHIGTDRSSIRDSAMTDSSTLPVEVSQSEGLWYGNNYEPRRPYRNLDHLLIAHSATLVQLRYDLIGGDLYSDPF